MCAFLDQGTEYTIQEIIVQLYRTFAIEYCVQF